jgi:hypothetical protein
VSGEPYVLLDRSLEEVVQHIAKDLNGRIQLSWPVTKVSMQADATICFINVGHSHCNAARLYFTCATLMHETS